MSSEERPVLLKVEGLKKHFPITCPFAPRCSKAFERCLQENPSLINRGKNHKVACWWNSDSGEKV